MKSDNQTRLRKFNPGAGQTDREIIDQFVVRERELESVLDVLRENIDAPSCQHLLVVAPRGRGKTMLLERVAAELRTNRQFSEKLLPVRFMEESHEVFSIAEFWLECLLYLANAIARIDPERAVELRRTREDLVEEMNEEVLEQRARAAVLDTADVMDRKLVLMVENLQDLTEDADDEFGWQLRKILQTENSIMLLGTATSRFKVLDKVEQPFFELFRIIFLEPLTTDECARLWRVASGDDVTEREITPLKILTGGSPRLLVIVADFSRHRSIRQLMEELVTLIDEHTEYFRSHLDALAKTERRVYLAVIDLWQASSTAEIAKRARMDVRATSSLLGRLVDRGAVLVEGSDRKRRYSATERLYSIYYKLRKERDEAAVVRNLILFMTAFYNRPELTQLSKQLMEDSRNSPGIRDGLKQLLAEFPEACHVLIPAMSLADYRTLTNEKKIEGQWLDAINRHVADAIDTGDYNTVVDYSNRMISEMAADDDTVTGLEVAKAMVIKGLAQHLLNQPETAIETYEDLVQRFSASDHLEVQVLVAKALVDKGDTQVQLNHSEAAIETYEDLVQRFRASDHPEVQVQVALALVKKGVVQEQLNRLEAAIETCEEMLQRFGASDHPEVQVQMAMALITKGLAQGQLNRPEAAIETCEEILQQFGASDHPKVQVAVAIALLNKSLAQEQLNQLEAAIETYEDLVQRFRASDHPEVQVQVALALVKKGLAQEQLKRPEAAIETFEEVVQQFSASDHPEVYARVALALVKKGLVQAQLNQPAAAIETYDEMVQRFGSSQNETIATTIFFARAGRLNELLALNQLDQALDDFRLVYEGFVVSRESMLPTIQKSALALVGSGVSANDVCDILLQNPEKSEALQPLIVALRQEVGEEVRAPAEVLEVAADIRAEIEKRRKH